MKIAGTEVKFWPYATTRITPAIKWVEDSNGIWNGSDRGASQDVYEAELTLYDSIENIRAVQSLIHSVTGRFGVLLTEFTTVGQDIFGPEVDYNFPGGIGATITDFGFSKYPNFNKTGDLKMKIRGIGLPQIGNTPSLANLNLQENWDGDSDHFMNKDFSYTQGFYPVHHLQRGRFTGEFEQTELDTKQILAYLLTTARSNTVSLPAFTSGLKIFGEVFPYTGGTCVIRSIEVTRKFIDRWKIKFEINEVALTF